jgi:uncharacterized protein (DUF849 family)
LKDLIVNFAPTGMVPTKLQNDAIPISPNEIIEQVLEAYELGITIVHLHARDEDGCPTYKPSTYTKIITGIKIYAPELVICTSLSGRNFNTLDKRSAVLELQPDMASLTLSSLNFPNQTSVNSPDMIKALLQKMHNFGVNPELEVFDLGMINYSKYLIRKKLLKPPYYFNIIAGNIAGIQSDLLSLGTAVNVLPENSIWSIGGIGNQQLVSNAIAIAIGGGVRVGMEDNLYFDANKKVKATNINLLKRIRLLANIHDREIMRPEKFGALGFYNKNTISSTHS